jgi:hypothetical protein
MNLENVDYSEGGAPRRSFLQRLRGALLIDATVYEEVEHDPASIGQAAVVVALAALSAGAAGFSDVSFVRGILMEFVLWGIGTGTVWVIGVALLKHTSDFPELARTLGFAMAPQILLVVAILPLGPLAGLLALAVILVSIVAWVVAARQALDISTGRAVAICVGAYILSAIVNGLLAGL